MVYDWSVGSPGQISPIDVAQPGHQPTPTRAIATRPAERQAAARRALLRARLGPPGELDRDLSRRCARHEEHRVAEHAGADRRSRRIADAVPPIDQNGEMTFTYDTVATGYRTTPILGAAVRAARQRVPPSPVPADGASSRPQPALRLTPPTVQLSCTVRHFVYYPDATSIQQHAQAALNAGWVGCRDLGAAATRRRRLRRASANTTPYGCRRGIRAVACLRSVPGIVTARREPAMAGSYIVAGARTPIGKMSGALASLERRRSRRVRHQGRARARRRSRPDRSSTC